MKDDTSSEIKVAEKLGELPSEEVKQLAKTKTQVQYWHDRRSVNQFLSRRWIREIENKPDLHAYDVQKGLIKQSSYEQLHGRIQLFRSLWRVIKVGEQYIKAELLKKGVEYPFDKPENLYTSILTAWEDDTYQTCLEPHHGMTVTNWGRLAGVIEAYARNQGIPPNDIVRAELRQQTKSQQVFNNPWLLHSLKICRDKASSDVVLKHELEAFHFVNQQLGEFVWQWTERKRPSKKYGKLRTSHWINGEKENYPRRS